MTPAPLLELDAVRISYDDASRATPDGVSLDIRPGEVVLVLGPSGCGKSTLALALDGLVPHAIAARLEGSVRVAGADTRDRTVAELSEHVAMVFQDPDAQVVTGTLLDEVGVRTREPLVPAAEVLERAERALKLVGLWDRRADNPDVLSGGGRQRLAIACALALASPVLVLDEPTANLDPAGIDEVYAVLRELANERDHAIVLIEHNLDAAVDLVDRVIVLDAAGRLVIDGPVREVLQGRAERAARARRVAARSRRSRPCGCATAGVPLDPLPLTPAELAAALEAIDALPSPAAVGRAETARCDPRMPRRPGRPPRSRCATARCDAAAAAARSSSTASTSTWHPATSSRSSAPTARARPRCCRRSPGSSRRRPASVDVLGIDPSRADARDRARRIGFVFQNPEHQFVAHTVADELELGLRLQGVPEAERRDEVERMLRRFDLVEHRDRHPFLLSGGQKRRLSVGTALVAGAPVLALDEPTFGQDRARAAELLDILRTLNDEGTTVLVVTHDLQLVADYADRRRRHAGRPRDRLGPHRGGARRPADRGRRPSASAARARDPQPRAPPRVAVGHADVAAARPRGGPPHERHHRRRRPVARNPYAEQAPGAARRDSCTP